MPQEVRTKSGKNIYETASHWWVRKDEAHLIGQEGQTVRVYAHI